MSRLENQMVEVRCTLTKITIATVSSTLLIAILMAVSGCAGPNELVHTYNSAGSTAGFWAGLWHGFCGPFALFGSLFMDINIYEVHNKGFLYNFGFLIGLGSWGASAAAR